MTYHLRIMDIYSFYFIFAALDMLSYQQKLIKMADSSEYGWKVVKEYESNPLAEDSEDEKTMYKAEARANQNIRAERAKKSKRTGPYSRVTANHGDAICQSW